MSKAKKTCKTCGQPMPKSDKPKGSSYFDEAKHVGSMLKQGFDDFTGRYQVKQIGKDLQGGK